MAGLGFKDFQVGEVLTSSDVDGYLMQQSVMRFADAAARGSALGTAVGTAVPLAEGMVTYLDDVNQVQVFDGTSWTAAGKVLQVVRATDSTERTTTSNSFVDAGLSATITPTDASSTLVCIWICRAQITRNATGGNFFEGQITDASDVALTGAEAQVLSDKGNVSQTVKSSAIVRGEVAAGSTSAQTFKTRFRISATSDTRTGTLQNADNTGSLYIYEVAA